MQVCVFGHLHHGTLTDHDQQTEERDPHKEALSPHRSSPFPLVRSSLWHPSPSSLKCLNHLAQHPQAPVMNFLLFENCTTPHFLEFEYFIFMCSKKKSEHCFYFEFLTAFE